MLEICSGALRLFDFSDHEHLITYAEEGFSPLSERLRSLGYTKEETVEIANHVNESDSPYCLLPDFPVTIIPRKLIRQEFNQDEFEDVIARIISKCDERYGSRHLLFDFRAPNVCENISRSIRTLFSNGSRFANITEFRIEDDFKREKPEFFNAVEYFCSVNNRFFKYKTIGRSIFSDINRTMITKPRSRHWFNETNKFHTTKLIQPRDIPVLIRLLTFPYNKENKHELRNTQIHHLSNFLSIVTITNLISQVVHHSGLQLKETLGKVLLFPEIVGDCPSMCDFHHKPTFFPNLILEIIKVEFSEEIETLIRYETNKKILELFPQIIIYLEEILSRLVDRNKLDLAKKAVASYLTETSSLNFGGQL
jgi:hypothetical protein